MVSLEEAIKSTLLRPVLGMQPNYMIGRHNPEAVAVVSYDSNIPGIAAISDRDFTGITINAPEDKDIITFHVNCRDDGETGKLPDNMSEDNLTGIYRMIRDFRKHFPHHNLLSMDITRKQPSNYAHHIQSMRDAGLWLTGWMPMQAIIPCYFQFPEKHHVKKMLKGMFSRLEVSDNSKERLKLYNHRYYKDTRGVSYFIQAKTDDVYLGFEFFCWKGAHKQHRDIAFVNITPYEDGGMRQGLAKLMEIGAKISADAILDLPPSNKPGYENLLLELGYRVRGIALRQS
jgi:hypothetical protein